MEEGIRGCTFLGSGPACGMVLRGAAGERVLNNKSKGKDRLDAEYRITGIPRIPGPARLIELRTLAG